MEWDAAVCVFVNASNGGHFRLQLLSASVLLVTADDLWRECLLLHQRLAPSLHEVYRCCCLNTAEDLLSQVQGFFPPLARLMVSPVAVATATINIPGILIVKGRRESVATVFICADDFSVGGVVLLEATGDYRKN